MDKMDKKEIMDREHPTYDFETGERKGDDKARKQCFAIIYRRLQRLEKAQGGR